MVIAWIRLSTVQKMRWAFNQPSINKGFIKQCVFDGRGKDLTHSKRWIKSFTTITKYIHIIVDNSHIHLGDSINGDTPKWLVDSGKSFENG